MDYDRESQLMFSIFFITWAKTFLIGIDQLKVIKKLSD